MQDKDETMLRARVPVVLMREAARVAAERDEFVSQVVRRALREYVANAPRQGDLEAAIAATRRPRSGRRSS